MRIEIVERMRPFSHQPGVRCPLPLTHYALQVYPTLLRVIDLRERHLPVLREIALPYRGPVKDFTVQLDLERGTLRVWGESEGGFFRFRVEQGRLITEKGPELEALELEVACAAPANPERLWLGSHKQLHWERLSLRERLPLCLRLAQWMPQQVPRPLVGELEDLFALICRDMLLPCPVDELHQGIEIPGLAELTPLEALHALAEHCRALFIDKHHILPKLPAAFHCGRYLSDQLEFEWSKKQIRRLRFRSQKGGALPLSFRHVTSCRVRQSRHELGSRKDLAQPITVEPNCSYLLDRFER